MQPTRFRATLLIVDSDVGLREPVCRMLHARGYRTLPAGDAATALELVSRHDGEIDGAVIDFGLPHMDGIALRDAIARQGRSLPTLFLSGYSMGARPRLGYDHAVLDKPFLPGDFLAAVETLLNGRAVPPSG